MTPNQLQAPHLSHRAQHAELGAPVGEFLPFESGYAFVTAVMQGRVDHNGVLSPLVEEHTQFRVPEASIRPLPNRVCWNKVLPGEPESFRLANGGVERVSWDYDTAGIINNMLVGREEEVWLSGDEIDVLGEGQRQLEAALNKRGDLRWGVNDSQTLDAYHIKNPSTALPNSDPLLAVNTRIYVSSLATGPAIVQAALDKGVDFEHIKVWKFQAAQGPQSIRLDCPIFFANTAAQLDSIANALRAVATEQPDLFVDAIDPLLGIPVVGVPGASIAQASPGSSFNGELSNFLASAIEGGCNSVPYKADRVIDNDWIEEATKQSIRFAQDRALDAGRNPDCLAAVAGQDPEVLYAIAAG